jgi:hypothetical protein
MARDVSQAIESLLSSRNIAPIFQGASIVDSYAELDPDSKQIVDEFVETLKPDIEQKATALITAELRDRVARTGDIARIKKLLKKGKKPSLKRKKGCIYVQFGTGDPDDEIEEFLLMSC